MAAAGWYVFVYLYRWEWNRALVSGIIFLAAEVALLGASSSLDVDSQPKLDGTASTHSTGPPDERVLRRLREHAPEPAKPFAWLERSQTNVFVPVLLGAGVVLSASGLGRRPGRPAHGRADDGARPRPPAQHAAAAARRPPRRAADRSVPTAMKRLAVAVAVVATLALRHRRARRPDPEPARTTSATTRRRRSCSRSTRTASAPARTPPPPPCGRVLPAQTSSRASDDGGLAPIGDGRYRVVLRAGGRRPRRRKLVGCLEDLTVDRVRRRRRVVPDVPAG